MKRDQSVSHKKPCLFFFLAWIFPGLGHFLQKRILKGVVFLSGILSLLILGLIMKGQIGFLYDYQPLTIIRFLGSLGSGVLYFLLKLTGLGAGNIGAVSFDYGSAYLISAGLLNYLIAFNAYRIAKGMRDV